VNKAYRCICDKCAEKDSVCSKCLIHVNEYAEPDKQADAVREKKEEQEIENFLDTLRERVRRTMVRKLEAGEVDWIDGGLVDVGTGEPVTGLQFKGIGVGEADDAWEDDGEDIEEDDDEELDDDEDFEDDEEEEEKSKAKKGAKQKPKK